MKISNLVLFLAATSVSFCSLATSIPAVDTSGVDKRDNCFYNSAVYSVGSTLKMEGAVHTCTSENNGEEKTAAVWKSFHPSYVPVAK